jgi:hypothetical protein
LESNPTKIGNTKRSGWIGFVYFKDFKKAIELREKLYFNRDCYVILQDDKRIVKYYEHLWIKYLKKIESLCGAKKNGK